MKFEQQVTSLEISKKLKELGVKQESLFWWIADIERLYKEHPELEYDTYRCSISINELPEDKGEKLNPKSKLVFRPQGGKIITPEAYSTFTVAELGEMLPKKIRNKENNGNDGLQSWKWNGWNIEYHETFKAPQIRILNEGKLTEADARGKMLIYLLENNLIIK